MWRLAAAVVIAVLALLGAAASARSQPRSFYGYATVGIKGWGTIKDRGGVFGNPTVQCSEASCPGQAKTLSSRHVVLVEKPYKGWKFGGWHGACKNKKPKCVVDAAHIHKNAYGQRNVNVVAKFIPVAPGLSSAKPLPIGTAADVGENLVVRVNSANANVQLTPPAPAGAEYFDANVTVTYTGGGSQYPNWFGFSAVGSHNAPYSTVSGEGCGYPGPQPPLDVNDPLYSGQSTTGYICWTIAANDASTLELYFGDRTVDYPGTIWFALH
jgi:hypothetical protein